MKLDPQVLHLFRETFFPFAARASISAQLRGGRFAYYTTAATAIQILRNRTSWPSMLSQCVSIAGRCQFRPSN
jgi:hypothetical protein